MKITAAEVEKVLQGLAETIQRIEASTASRKPEELAQIPGKGKWSAVDVLAHLRACDDVWRHSIYAMLAQDHPILPDLDERRWARSTRPGRQDFQRSFDALRLSREELLCVLHALSLEGWARDADIGGRRHTVFSQSRRLAKHEAEHCRQIDDIFNGQTIGSKG